MAVSSAEEKGVHGQSDLREAIRQYEILLEGCLSELPPSKRDEADQVLARMKTADRALSEAKTATSTANPRQAGMLLDAPSPRQTQLQTERFLGDVSDVRFFNLIKQVMQSHLGPTEAKQSIESYEQDDNSLSPSVVSNRVAQLPDPDKLIVFTNAYFSTIHLAFPFICQAPFMRSLNKVQTTTNSASIDSTTLALICTIMHLSTMLCAFKLTPYSYYLRHWCLLYQFAW